MNVEIFQVPEGSKKYKSALPGRHAQDIIVPAAHGTIVYRASCDAEGNARVAVGILDGVQVTNKDARASAIDALPFVPLVDLQPGQDYVVPLFYNGENVELHFMQQVSDGLLHARPRRSKRV